MTAQEVLEVIEKGEYECYGIRRDRGDIEAGYKFPNSHQWYQDDPSNWGEELPYNEDMGFWDGGELPGVCTLRVRDWPTVEQIAKTMEDVIPYNFDGATYLVGGDWCEGGNDINESIIHNGVCVCKISD